MTITRQDIKDLKNKISLYYDNQKRIKIYKEKLDILNQKSKEIETEITGLNLQENLRTDIYGVNYDRIIVNGGKKESFVEREIERIYKKFEEELEELQNDIVVTKETIRRLEKANLDMMCHISQLNEFQQKILELRYKDKKRIYEVAGLLNMSETSINHNIKLICESILMRDLTIT